MAFRIRLQKVAAGLATRPCRPFAQPVTTRLHSYSQAAAASTSNLGQSVQDSIAVSLCPATVPKMNVG